MRRKFDLAGLLLLLIFTLLILPASVQAAPITSLDRGWKYMEPASGDKSSSGFVFQVSSPAYHSEEWNDLGILKIPPVSDDAKVLWMTTLLPEVMPYRHATLAFLTNEQAVRVYLGNKLIYINGEFGLKDHEYGQTWHIIDLPHNAQGKQLSIQLYTDHPHRLGTIENISIGESTEHLYSIMWHNSLTWLALPMAFLLFIIMVPCYQFLRSHRLFIIHITVFLLDFTIWLISGLHILQVMFPMPASFWSYMWLVSFYLMPIFMMLGAREAMPEKRSQMMLIMADLCALFFIAAIAGEVLGHTCLDNWLELYLMISWLFLLVTAAVLEMEAKQGSEMCYSLIWPAALLPLLQIGQVLCRLPIAPLIILPLMAVVLWLLRHALNERQRLRIQNMSLEKRVAAAQQAAQIDPLTKCFNRGQLSDSLSHETQLSSATGSPLSFLMFDLDHFKAVNDTFGHDAGDQVLEGFATLVRRHLDARHIFIRYGGEEFVVLCRGFGLDEALEFADSIRADLYLAVLIPNHRITCSIGVSTWHGINDNPFALQKRADKAAYRAKETGRNKVVSEVEIMEKKDKVSLN